MFDIHATMRRYRINDGLMVDDAPIDIARARRLADLYQSLPHTPTARAVAESYAAFRYELSWQYHYLVRSGLHIEPWLGDGEPYDSSRAMLADLSSGHLYYLQTASAGSMPADHPMLSADGPRHGMAHNDVFRAVHDAIGHGVSGSTFTARGEDLAFKTHKRTLTPASHLALCCETRAQSYWVNFGRHLRRPDGTLPRKGEPDYTPLSARPFAPNKAVNLPAWAIED